MLQTASRTYLAQTRFLFYCNIKIKVPIQYGELLLEECFQLLEQIELRYNSYQPGSYFYTINQYAGTWVDVDDHCFEMLKKIRFVFACTMGAYDVSCMPLLRLWGFYRTAHQQIPGKEQIQEVLGNVGFRLVELQENKVRIPEGYELTTGSFIKSFAVDTVVQLLKNRGVRDAVINAGGSTIFGLNDHAHENWSVNIPGAAKLDEMPAQVHISNQCFSLSARAHNYISVGGKNYGHILNAVTGYPASTLQTGVRCKNAFLADVLSTALFVTAKDHLGATVHQLKKRFEFDYFRIEESGEKTTSECF